MFAFYPSSSSDWTTRRCVDTGHDPRQAAQPGVSGGKPADTFVLSSFVTQLLHRLGCVTDQQFEDVLNQVTVCVFLFLILFVFNQVHAHKRNNKVMISRH